MSEDHISQRSALVLYGSETGNSQDVAEEISRLCQRLRFDTKVIDLNSIGLDELLRHTVVIFSVSTTGQGEIPGNAQLFWKKLKSVRLRPGCLSALQFTSFGLGDSSYPKFNWAHRKLYNRLRILGAQPVCERGESDEQHPEGIDGAFLAWTVKLRQSLLEWYPLPTGLDAISDDVFLSPQWELHLHAEMSSEGNELEDTARPPNFDGHISTDLTTIYSNIDNTHADKPSISKERKFTATLLSNTRVTPTSHWQDVRFLEFCNPSIDYRPGDVLTINPHNSASAVDEFLTITNWASIADSLVSFRPSPTRNTTSSPPSYSIPSPLTLRTLLTKHLDLNAIPRRSFFSMISHFTSDPTQKARLLEFTDPAYIDELFDYTTRPRRSIVEVLQEFYTVCVPFKYLAAVLPAIRGRQFSIASGGALKMATNSIPASLANGAHSSTQHTSGVGRIQLLVAIVRYRTVIKKIREGLCSRYLAELQPGTKVDVLLCKGGMKIAMDRPAVMIGPGTGVAPLRAMIHERVARDAGEVEDPSNGTTTTASPRPESDKTSANRDQQKQLLFFGGRNRAADYFFKDDWTALQARGVPLDVVSAFSRDQPNKVYVQDTIRERAAAVYSLLREDAGGSVYVCGSSGKMPQAVREALIEVFEQEGGFDRADAERRLVDMEKDGRYQQETW